MTPWVRRLLIANVIVYVLQLASPLVTEWLEFVPILVLQRPWTVVTYMFTHDPGGFSHILFNMLSLFWFGPRVESRLGGAHFIRLYLLSGVTGALLSILTPTSAIVGASGAIFGVALAFARFWPRQKIYIYGMVPVEARVLVLFMTGLSLTLGFSGGGNIAHFAHLGGYLGAWIYLALAERYSPSRQWRAKVEAAPPELRGAVDWSKIDLAGVHSVNREEIERLLAKIAELGDKSLSVEEKVFLSHFLPRQG